MSVAENKMLIARRSKVVFTGSPNGIGGIAILDFQLIALFMHMNNSCTLLWVHYINSIVHIAMSEFTGHCRRHEG